MHTYYILVLNNRAWRQADNTTDTTIADNIVTAWLAKGYRVRVEIRL
jgi:hypothetical protein